jgi:hypothetical protein
MLFGQGDLSEVYRAIGHFTVNWASLEMSLDSCNFIFYKRCGGRARINTQIPTSLKPKIAFFRRCLTNLPVLQPYAVDGLKLADRIGNLKRDRHDSVHGFVLDWNPETKSVSRSIYEYNKPDYSFRDHEVTVPQIEAWALETGRLTLDLMAFTQDLLEGIVKPQNTLRGSTQ